MLYLRSPSGSSCSISDDLSCFHNLCLSIFLGSDVATSSPAVHKHPSSSVHSHLLSATDISISLSGVSPTESSHLELPLSVVNVSEKQSETSTNIVISTGYMINGSSEYDYGTSIEYSSLILSPASPIEYSNFTGNEAGPISESFGQTLTHPLDISSSIPMISSASPFFTGTSSEKPSLDQSELSSFQFKSDVIIQRSMSKVDSYTSTMYTLSSIQNIDQSSVHLYSAVQSSITDYTESTTFTSFNQILTPSLQSGGYISQQMESIVPTRSVEILQSMTSNISDTKLKNTHSSSVSNSIYDDQQSVASTLSDKTQSQVCSSPPCQMTLESSLEHEWASSYMLNQQSFGMSTLAIQTMSIPTTIAIGYSNVISPTTPFIMDSSSTDNSISPSPSHSGISKESEAVTTYMRTTNTETSVPVFAETTAPVLIKSEIIEIVFDGACAPLLHQDKIVLEEFWVGLCIILIEKLNFTKEQIKPKKITCEPISLEFELQNIPLNSNVTEQLTALFSSGKVSIPVLLNGRITYYNASSVRIGPEEENISKRYDESGLKQVDIIVITSVCVATVIIVCFGFIICAREYYNKHRARTFDLSEIDWNSKADDYTLTKIPRSRVSYSENGMNTHSVGKKSGKDVRGKSTAEENENLVSEVLLRVNADENGLTIGLTGMNIHSSNHDSPTHQSSDYRDQSKDLLVKSTGSPLHSMDNPIYFADDDMFDNEIV